MAKPKKKDNEKKANVYFSPIHSENPEEMQNRGKIYGAPRVTILRGKMELLQIGRNCKLNCGEAGTQNLPKIAEYLFATSLSMFSLIFFGCRWIFRELAKWRRGMEKYLA